MASKLVSEQVGMTRARELAVLLAQWQPDPLRTTLIQQIIGSGDVDWDHFIDVGVMHHVIPTLTSNLCSLNWPVTREIKIKLWAVSKLNESRSVYLAAKAYDIIKLLRNSGVMVKTFKGPDLGRRLFGDVTRRYSGDLDFLIPEDEVEKAHAILSAAGYPLVDRDVFHASHNCLLEQGEGNVALELHWGVSRPHLHIRDRTLVKDFVLDQNNQQVLEFILLAIHMGRHRRMCLKWLVDIDVYYRQMIATTGWEPEEVDERILAAAARYGAKRMVEAVLHFRKAVYGEMVEKGRVLGLLRHFVWLWFIPPFTPAHLRWKPYIGKYALIDNRLRGLYSLFRYPPFTSIFQRRFFSFRRSLGIDSHKNLTSRIIP